MKKLLITAVLLVIGLNYAFGQGELDKQQKVFFRNERTGAIYFSTDGYGLSYREGKRINYLNKRLIEFDIGHLVHPKEYRMSNPYYQTPGTFVFGKENSVFFIRGGLGHQHEIFKKADLGGIAIRYFFSGGPAIAFCKPIYYEILKSTNGQGTEFQIVVEKFDITKHDPTMIYGRSNYFKGFNEMKLKPGLYVKGGFNFEYSKQDKVIHAIEIGAQVNAFLQEVPIMATVDNKAVFFSLFVSYRFGVVLDPLDPESNKASGIFRKKSE
jgi:hypothetical protein